MAKLHRSNRARMHPAQPEPDKEFKPHTVEKPLRYYGHEEVLPLYSDVGAVRHTEQVFQLLFFQVVTPITGGSEQEAQKVLDSLDTIPAKCISKIYLTPPQMLDLYNAMGVNIAKWQKLIQYRTEEVQKALAEQKKAKEDKE